MKNSEKYLHLLQQNEKMIYSILYRQRLYPQHPYFQDFLQVGRLAFLEALETDLHQELTSENWQEVAGYVYQKVMWRIKDEMRLLYKKTGKDTGMTTELNDWLADAQGQVFEQELETMDAFQHLLREVTAKERHFLINRFVNDLSVTEYANKHGIARSSAYRMQKNIKQHYNRLNNRH